MKKPPLRPSSLSALAALCLLSFPAFADDAASLRALGVTEASLPRGETFTDVAAASGIDFVHMNGMSGRLLVPEIVGPGCALFDYDNDGDLDVYMAQGHMLGSLSTLDEYLLPPPPGGPDYRDRLYRNDLAIASDGTRFLKFVDVTEESGIDARGYGMCPTVGDYDNDGDLDLYVTNFGPNQLWKNNGDGTFEDATHSAGAGLDDFRWAASATWVDYDGDGDLDLYVTNYAFYDADDPSPCPPMGGYGGQQQLAMMGIDNLPDDYCGPMTLQPDTDILFRNNGDGTFEDVSESSGVSARLGLGLGVIGADFDGKWPMEIYVANDMWPNYLWKLQPDGKLEDTALDAGLAFNGEGEAESSMGVDLGDYNNDGLDDMFLSHMSNDTDTLYENRGEGFFDDASNRTGIARGSTGKTGFGAAWIDYDNNGWLDLFVSNGEIRFFPLRPTREEPLPMGQRNQLLRNLSGRSFKDQSRWAGAAFKVAEIGRGAAFGDIDNDGDTDILLANCAGPARLLLNRVGASEAWIGFDLKKPGGKLDALGARVEVRRKNGDTLWRRSRRDGSYLASNDARVLVGLGPFPEVTAVYVHWPEGGVEEWKGLSTKAYHTLAQGQGTAVADD